MEITAQQINNKPCLQSSQHGKKKKHSICPDVPGNRPLKTRVDMFTTTEQEKKATTIEDDWKFVVRVQAPKM